MMIMSTGLLKPAMGSMGLMAVDNARLFTPQKNLLIQFALRSSFYKQFAAGENEVEVGKTIRRMKRQGFSGVILGCAWKLLLQERTDSQNQLKHRQRQSCGALKSGSKALKGH